MNTATIFGVVVLSGGLLRIKTLLPLLGLGVVSALFFISSPGWRYRVLIEQHISNPGVDGALWNGLLACLNMISTYVTGSLLLLPLSLVLMRNMLLPLKVEAIPLKKIMLWCLLITIAGLAGAFVYLIAVDNNTAPPGRIFAVLGLLLHICAIVLIVYLPIPRIQHRQLPALLMGLLCIAAIAGHNNYTGILKEYNNGTYTRFATIYDNRLKAIRTALQKQQGWRTACFADETLEKNLIYYPVDMRPNRQSANNGYEKYFGLDEVYFCSDTLRKAQLILNGLP